VFTECDGCLSGLSSEGVKDFLASRHIIDIML